MSTKRFQILSVRRDAANGSAESLTFESGVNVIVGEPNTGKSKWIETIDFLLGDDKTAEEKLGEDIARKYFRAVAILRIGDDEFAVERRWNEAGAKSKFFVGDIAYDIHGFRQQLLDRIGIPSVHYPQGNPYGPRTWPELGWRSLFRHMYRRQRFWGDIADQQFPSEQHACLIQFLGMAESLFSHQYGEMIQKEKQIEELQSRKVLFLQTLHEVSKEIVDEDELGTAITPNALAAAKTRLEAEVNELNARRGAILSDLISSSASQTSGTSGDIVSRMAQEFAEIKEAERKHAEEIEGVQSRLDEIVVYEHRVVAEMGRLERAKEAGEVLADLKVTHCPVCDQEIRKAGDNGSSCYLCHQSMPTIGPIIGEPLKRLEFELDQLKGENKEISELSQSLQETKQGHIDSIKTLRAKASQLSELLRPIRMATAAVIPLEVAQIEMEVGRRIERIDQLRRIGESLAMRERIASRIVEIQKRVDELSSEVDRLTATLDFESAGDMLSDGMNDYVGQLMYDDKKMWTQQQIAVQISKYDFSIRVGRQKWQSQLGGTMTIYFLLAYHFALLRLSAKESSRIPGFLILDLPAEVEGEKVADKENFVLEPFIRLCGEPEYSDVQIIAVGSAFQGLEGVHRKELREVWTG